MSKSLAPTGDQFLPRSIVERYYAWLDTIFKPADKLKKAITYSLNQRELLCAFLDHGKIEISNNRVGEYGLSDYDRQKNQFSTTPKPGLTPA